jgi:hypothetical protein
MRPVSSNAEFKFSIRGGECLGPLRDIGMYPCNRISLSNGSLLELQAQPQGKPAKILPWAVSFEIILPDFGKGWILE